MNAARWGNVELGWLTGLFSMNPPSVTDLLFLPGYLIHLGIFND